MCEHEETIIECLECGTRLARNPQQTIGALTTDLKELSSEYQSGMEANAKLHDENARLKEALEWIVRQNSIERSLQESYDDCYDTARAALEAK